jgi:hypothetical protein
LGFFGLKLHHLATLLLRFQGRDSLGPAVKLKMKELASFLKRSNRSFSHAQRPSFVEQSTAVVKFAYA